MAAVTLPGEDDVKEAAWMLQDGHIRKSRLLDLCNTTVTLWKAVLTFLLITIAMTILLRFANITPSSKYYIHCRSSASIF
jgi:hypothetical protein